MVWGLAVFAAISLSACGGRGSPSVKAEPQTITFVAAPILPLHGSATVSAAASSGLAVSYSSATPAVCSVVGTSGVATSKTAGICIIAADQPGNDEFAPAPQATQSITVRFDPLQSISFGAAPALTLFGSTTVAAVASSGLKVSYGSNTPAVCSVNSGTGVVTDLAAGNCVVTADQAGDVNYQVAPQVTQTLVVAPWVGPVTAPGTPTGVAATLGTAPNMVTVSFVGPSSSGGSAIAGYTVSSNPGGIAATGTASPITLPCVAPCSGYTFAVSAGNAVGSSAVSAPAEVLNNYSVVATFLEPDTQPNNSIFIGSFTFNSTTGTVLNLQGTLSESMTGERKAYPKDNMTWLSLSHQLSSVYDSVLGGLLVTTFLSQTTNTLSNNPVYGGTDGWTPGTGSGLYYGYGTGIGNPGNAYVRIFVNTADPTASLTQAQLDKLAYADCAPGGMMGATCMTGTTKAGYGTIGSMSGYPVTQVITRK
ncbi:MAG: hypothetical protein NT123_16680 [Proteobacteria bacterium]|nr:hypothetical protein [Pseudomonadota bacterium]